MAATDEDRPEPAIGNPARPPSALVIEDSPIERILLRAALECGGFEVREAPDGDDAVRGFAQSPADIVFLDILMPGMNGFETCRRLRALPCGARTPVLVTTSLEDEQSIASAFDAGATDFIAKPFDYHALMHRARYVLRAHRVLGNLDALTGLPGRKVIPDWLAGRGEARRAGGGVRAGIYLDLDRFRRINETLGRESGDALLLDIADRLRASLRAGDAVSEPYGHLTDRGAPDIDETLLARAEGDEFVVWLDNLTDASDAGAVARRLLDIVREPVALGPDAVHLTACAGVAVDDGQTLTPARLIERAESALGQAKREGPGTLRFYDEAASERGRRLFALESVLRRALDGEHFQIHFQPKVDLATGAPRGMEALMRLDFPGHGPISPADFIPVAEHTGLILALDRWALRQSARQAMRCAEAGLDDLTLAVNVSPSSFQSGDLPHIIADVLDETRLPPQRLEVELTEGMLLDNTQASLATLRALRELGVRVAVDDFGTGYSSLGYLKHFKASGLKIDRSFVRDLADGSDDEAIVSAIATLGRKLRMTVVAEGVETEEQARILRVCGCHEAQGFLFSKALPVEEFIRWACETTLAVPA